MTAQTAIKRAVMAADIPKLDSELAQRLPSTNTDRRLTGCREESVMNYRKKLIAYIDAMHAGNRRAAAKAWGVNYLTLSGVINGYKGMGRPMARAICVRTGFALELESLARIRPVPGKRDRANEGAAV